MHLRPDFCRAFSLALLLPAVASAAIEDDLRACSSIAEPLDRVACYDVVAKGIGVAATVQTGEPQPNAAAGASAVASGPTRNVTASFGTKTSEVDEDASSRIVRYWELEEEAQRGRFVMLPHRPNYVLPATFNSKPNDDPFRSQATNFELERLEAKFQLSFKFKLWQDILNDKGDLWFAYTQQSYWQVYDQESSPFRETNYEPSLFLTYPVKFSVFGLRARMLALGFDHQSNGRDEPLSRSWNRIVASAVLEKGNLAAVVRAWYRIPEDRDDDDNPDIEDYLGHGDVVLSYRHNRNEWSATLKNNLDFDRNRSGVELAWSFGLPFTRSLSGYVQYYYGYGESLVDYDAPVNRIGIGFLISDWF